MEVLEPDDSRHMGKENRMKQGRTFFKGRKKQIRKEKNPEQWNTYNKISKVKEINKHFNSLSEQLIGTRNYGVLSKKMLSNHNKDDNVNDHEDNQANVNDEYLDAKSTHQILSMSKQQNKDDQLSSDDDENDDENDDNDDNDDDNKKNKKIEEHEMKMDQNNKNNNIPNKIFEKKVTQLTLEEILGNDDENKNDNENGSDNEKNKTNNYDMTFHDIKLTKEEENALELFMPKSTFEQMTLSEIIHKRIKQQETENMSQLGTEKIIQKKIPKQIIQVYKEVGVVLSKWRSGKLPKAFKMIPILEEWEELLYITNPDDWTPHVVFEATKMFSSQSKKDICQRFYNLILLPRVRRDIKENHKLNFHLFQAVRKSLFKSQAFFRGFFLPLCGDECRAREAVIIGSIIAKNSIPVIQSAIAIYKLLEFEYSGAIHHFLKTLLNKRYALPMKVIETLVLHFKKFENDPRVMPVIWHQAFLVFAQRYKKSINHEQKNSLKPVLKKQFHNDITPLIRKELFSDASQTVNVMDIDI